MPNVTIFGSNSVPNIIARLVTSTEFSFTQFVNAAPVDDTKPIILDIVCRTSSKPEPITDIASVLNPNVVKVSTDKQGYALTFSRAPLPWPRDAFAKSQDVMPEGVNFRRHIGIYAYREGFLADFVAWGPCTLELTESLEQLRALWNGARIHVADALEAPPAGVDTLEDLQRVRRFFEE